MQQHIIIVGPTASGKSSLAVELAQHLKAEVASVDAFQIYRGLDVGTGKITQQQRKGVPHHLLDLVDPEDEFSVADFLREATALVQSVKTPLIWAGGTGLYVSALLEGLSSAPPTPKQIQDELSERSTAWLRAEILKVDPVWAAGADLENPRRMIRALGVYLASGKTMSEWQQHRDPALLANARVFYLNPDPTVLRERTARRVAAMLQAGWVDEVQELMQGSNWLDCQAARAIGYREVALHIRGELTLEACHQEICTQTWQYARRQRTWFKKLKGLVVLDAAEPLDQILQEIERGSCG